MSEEEYEDIMNIRASNNMDHLTHSHLIHVFFFLMTGQRKKNTNSSSETERS